MQIAELFESINGEGVKAGERALFLRFPGCNLSCSWCDTAWVNELDYQGMEMTPAEILEKVRAARIRNITVTGGEPLLAEGIRELLILLAKEADPVHRIEIETNGSVALEPFYGISERIVFTMDYKLPGSGMEDRMRPENMQLLRTSDSVKFVVAGWQDLCRAKEVILQEKLAGRCQVFLSPVFGAITPEQIVDFIKENRLDGVRLQLQLHKIIWDPEKRGV